MLRNSILIFLLLCGTAWGQNTKPLIATDNSTQTCNTTRMVFGVGSLSCAGSVATISGGSGTIGGSIASTQVAYGTGTNTIGGNSTLTFDGTNVHLGSVFNTNSLVIGGGSGYMPGGTNGVDIGGSEFASGESHFANSGYGGYTDPAAGYGSDLKLGGGSGRGSAGSSFYGLAVYSDATFLGDLYNVTQSASDNSTKVASTAYVTTGISNAIAGVNLAGDVTGTVGATSVVKVNGASIPASAFLLSTNSSGQFTANTTGAYHTLLFVCNNGGSVLNTGICYINNPIDWGGTLKAVYVDSPDNTSGSCTIDIYRANAAVPTSSNSIIGAAAKPTISSGKYVKDTTFTSWTSITFSADDEVAVDIASVTSFKNLSVGLVIQQTS